VVAATAVARHGTAGGDRFINPATVTRVPPHKLALCVFADLGRAVTYSSLYTREHKRTLRRLALVLGDDVWCG
jgi:hypothetical protein